MNTDITVKKKGWQRVLLITVPYFITVGLFQIAGCLLAGIPIENSDCPASTLQVLIVCIFGFLGTLLIIWLFRKFIDKESFVSLGFQTNGLLRNISLGLAIGFVIMLSGFLILLFTQEITFQNFHLDIIELMFSFALFTFVALLEELFIRGYVLCNLMRSFNRYVALVISSVLFSLMHILNPNISLFALVELTFAGIALGLSYIYTKN